MGGSIIKIWLSKVSGVPFGYVLANSVEAAINTILTYSNKLGWDMNPTDEIELLNFPENDDFDQLKIWLEENGKNYQFFTHTERKSKYKIGDKVRIAYLSDGHPLNNAIGTVTWLHDYYYYPEGNNLHPIRRTQGEISYPNGFSLEVSNMDREPGGVVSPVEIVEECV